LKSHVLSWRQKVYADWEDVISSGRTFQVFGPATGKARLPTVDRLTGGKKLPDVAKETTRYVLLIAFQLQTWQNRPWRVQEQ